jgi:hypothetical protein
MEIANAAKSADSVRCGRAGWRDSGDRVLQLHTLEYVPVQQHGLLVACEHWAVVLGEPTEARVAVVLQQQRH